MTLDGNSTNVVKLQLESVIKYNLTLIKYVGKFAISAAGSGTLTSGPDSLAATGDNLVVRANTAISSEADIVVTVTGTDQNDAALTGTATIAAQVAEGQSYEVVPASAGKRFKTISGVTITGGVNGDGFDIAVLPASGNDVEIKFDQGLSPSLGTEVKPIYHKYDLDHNKRIRGDHTLSLSQFYMHGLDGVARLHNRDMVVVQGFYDDGQSTPTEVRYFDLCRLSVSVESPAAEDGEVTASGEGTFGKMFVFS